MKSLPDVLRLILTCLALTLLQGKLAFGFSLPLTEFTLPNGLQVMLIEDHRAPVVLHAIAYKVGGADEEPGKTGLAHFFEHLMFKGTAKYPRDSFDRLMDENGAERNAFTTHDVTVFHERAGVDLLGLMMDPDADRMQNLQLTDDVLETERKVVQEERRQQTESSPYAVAGEKLDATLFKVHPYGRPVVGLPQDVAALTRADAEAFYRSHYMPGNAIVMVVGDVTPQKVRELADRYYAPLKNPSPVPVRTRPAEPELAQSETVEVQDARVNDPVFIRKYVVPASNIMSARETAAINILSVILGGNTESRFEKQLVVARREAAAADAQYSGQSIDYGSYQVYGVPTPGGDVLQLQNDVDAMLLDIARDGIAPEELEWAKNTTLASYIYALDNPTGFAMMIGLAVAMGENHDDIVKGDEMIAAVTREDVQKAAQQIFANRKAVTLILRPKS